uniref:Uncharacterized protein n=1 Tax=Parascaris univalens TaxID=6257 RepID=A0A915A1N0_PARUN
LRHSCHTNSTDHRAQKVVSQETLKKRSRPVATRRQIVFYITVSCLPHYFVHRVLRTNRSLFSMRFISHCLHRR